MDNVLWLKAAQSVLGCMTIRAHKIRNFEIRKVSPTLLQYLLTRCLYLFPGSMKFCSPLSHKESKFFKNVITFSFKVSEVFTLRNTCFKKQMYSLIEITCSALM